MFYLLIVKCTIFNELAQTQTIKNTLLTIFQIQMLKKYYNQYEICLYLRVITFNFVLN